MAMRSAREAWDTMSVEASMQRMTLSSFLDRQVLRKTLAQHRSFGAVLDYFASEEWQREKATVRPIIRGFGEECEELATLRGEINERLAAMGAKI